MVCPRRVGIAHDMIIALLHRKYDHIDARGCQLAIRTQRRRKVRDDLVEQAKRLVNARLVHRVRRT